MKLEASKPKNAGPAAPEKLEATAEKMPAGSAPEGGETAAPESRTPAPAKILFAETIGTDGKVTPAHEAELARISERALLTSGRDPRFKQKQFADWHGWCHWRASFSRVQVALHQAEADRWELRKKGKDADKENSIKAKIESNLRKINQDRAKLGKPPVTLEQLDRLQA